MPSIVEGQAPVDVDLHVHILKFKADKCTVFFDMASDACINVPLFSCPTEHAYETLL